MQLLKQNEHLERKLKHNEIEQEHNLVVAHFMQWYVNSLVVFNQYARGLAVHSEPSLFLPTPLTPLPGEGKEKTENDEEI